MEAALEEEGHPPKVLLVAEGAECAPDPCLASACLAEEGADGSASDVAPEPEGDADAEQEGLPQGPDVEALDLSFLSSSIPLKKRKLQPPAPAPAPAAAAAAVAGGSPKSPKEGAKGQSQGLGLGGGQTRPNGSQSGREDVDKKRKGSPVSCWSPASSASSSTICSYPLSLVSKESPSSGSSSGSKGYSGDTL